MAVRIYNYSNAIAFDYGPTDIQYFLKSDDFSIQITGGSYISIYSIAQSEYKRQIPYRILPPTIYSDITDQLGNPLGLTPEDTIAAIVIIIDSNENGAFALIKYVASNYTDLSTVIAPPTTPDIEIGQIAYVYNSQGTQWLPGSVGGTYYPNGFYVYGGAEWVSDRNAIATALADRALSSDPRFANTNEKAALVGTSGGASTTNRYVTDSDSRNSNSRTPLPHTHIPSEVGLGNVPNIDATNPSNITQDTTHRFATDAEKVIWNAKQSALGFTPENIANKGVANGYASLDGSGLVPAAQLPSYVDDVLEFANLAAFPNPGATGKIYVSLAVNLTYRWSGSAYVEISASPGSTDAVPEGVTNLYFTAARVLAALLVGLSVVTNSAILSTDTIIIAFGKIQSQINAILLLVPTAGQKLALVGNSGAPGSANRYVTENGLLTALSQSGVAVTRPVNGTAFTPSVTKYTRAVYTVRLTASISLSGNGSAIAICETSPDNVTWTEQSRAEHSYSGGVIVGIAITSVIAIPVAAFVSPNNFVRIRSVLAGGGTVVYVSGNENQIG